MAKRTAGLDSAHQTGQTIPPSDVLIVDEDAHGKGLKNCDVEDVFECEGRTNRDMAKWMTPLDWGHEIGLNILQKKNIMMKKEFYEWRFKNGYIFVYI